MIEVEGTVFLDTNVFVYSLDEREPAKREKSISLIEKIQLEKNGVVSNQVLAELFSAATRKLSAPLSPRDAASVVAKLADSPSIHKISYSHETVKKAAATSSQTGASFWDALIAETMKENSVEAIYTENEKDFRKIPGIKVINPFKK